MSSTKSKNKTLTSILRSAGAFLFADLIKSYFKGKSLINEDKPFTILIPYKKELDRLCLITNDDAYVKYIIKSHFIPQDIRNINVKNTKIKTRTDNYDLKFISSHGDKIKLEDSNKNVLEAKLVNPSKLHKIKKGVNYSVYQFQDKSAIECNLAGKKHKPSKVKGGKPNESLNACRLEIHWCVLNKFKAYLHDRKNRINPYGPACAGLLNFLEYKEAKTECKLAAYLMTHCSFGLFYILVQPFKSEGNHFISNELIEEWAGMEYYPADICGYFCNFVAKHLPEVYNNQDNLLAQINQQRVQFNPSADYQKWLLDVYTEFNYPDSVKGLLKPEEKYFYDELKHRLCGIYCLITSNESNFENVLMYNMQLIELLFPCNKEMEESKFMGSDYKENLRREDLLIPGSIYKFVQSTDFLSMFIDLDRLRQYENITNNANDVNLNNKKIFNSENYRCEVMNLDKEKIAAVNKRNRILYS